MQVDKIADLEVQKAKLESKVLKSATEKRNFRESKRYHVKQGKVEIQDTKLAKKFDSLQNRHDAMEEELDTTKRKLIQMEKEKMENIPTLKEGKQYNFKVRECFMGLASFGVSTSKMSNVAALVQNTIGGYDISEKDLPKQTFNKYMPREANLVAPQFVADELQKHPNTTLHTDGTSRDGDKVVNFELTVDKGVTLTAGILPVATGESDQQMEAFIF